MSVVSAAGFQPSSCQLAYTKGRHARGRNGEAFHEVLISYPPHLAGLALLYIVACFTRCYPAALI